MIVFEPRWCIRKFRTLNRLIWIYLYGFFQLTFGGKLTNAEMKNAASKIKIEKKVLIIEERFEKFVWWRADEHKTATNTSRLTLDWAFFLYFTQLKTGTFFWNKGGAKYDYVHLRIKRKFDSNVLKYSYRVRIWFDL